MKKILITLSLVACAAGAYSQGFVNWGTAASAITAQTNSTTYSPLYGGGSTGGGAVGGTANTSTGFYYELLYNTAFTGSQVAGASSPSNSYAALFGGSWLDTGLSATNASSAAGRLAPNPSGTAQVTGLAASVTNNMVLVGWSANLGTSWSVVSNELAQWNTGNDYSTTITGTSFFGVSAAGYLAAASGSPGISIFSSSGLTPTSQGLPILSLNTQLYELPTTIVPEPSTMALAGLGGLSMLLFRRKK